MLGRVWEILQEERIGRFWEMEDQKVQRLTESQGMKKHGFSGQPASHGQSLMHRGMGSAGGSQGSGSRVLPGKRMAGKMGNERVTVKNLKIMQVDEVHGLIVVNGMLDPSNSSLLLQNCG
jgi:large subunit ribosomal protein L3